VDAQGKPIETCPGFDETIKQLLERSRSRTAPKEPDPDLFKRIDDDLNPSAWVRWGVGVGCALMGAFFVTASWLAYALFWG
jgi:hypothetical protein